MSLFLDPTGRSTFGIGICMRCRMKKFLDELKRDPDTGLRVCSECIDQRDPWTLPARQADNVALPFYSPDEKLDTFTPADESPTVGGIV